MSPTLEVKEEITVTNNEIDKKFTKNGIEIKTEAKEFLSCCNQREEKCYLLLPAPKPQLSIDPIISPMFEVKEEITVTDNEIDITKNEMQIKTEAKEFLSCCNKGEEECYLLHPSLKPQLNMDPIMSPMFEMKEKITVMDNEIDIITKNEIQIKTEADCIDYNCCCYCNEEFASAEIRDKHEVQCHMGPQRLSVTDVQDAVISNCSDDGSREMISQSSKQKCLHQQLHLHWKATKHELGTYSKNNLVVKISPSDGEGAEDHYKEENYKCDQCNHKTPVSRNLKRHKLIHDVEGIYKKYKCELCGYKTHRSGDLKKHKLTHDIDQSHMKYKCELCDYRTHHSGSLKRHKLTHDIDQSHKKYKCELCDYKTHRSGDLNSHKLTHDVEETHKKYKCEFCAYKTHRNSDFNRHKLTHDVDGGYKKYKCEVCGYKTHRKGTLNKHKFKHDVEGIYKKYKCELCDYKTHHKDKLSEHNSTHDIDESHKKYKCELCAYETHFSKLLRQHKLRHKTHKNYKCDQCDYKTHTSRNLRQHKLTHETHKNYKCDRCDYKTYRNGNLKRHKLKHDRKQAHKSTSVNYVITKPIIRAI